MYSKFALAAAIGVGLSAPVAGFAAEDADIQKVRDEIRELKQSYDARIQQLEQRLESLQRESAPVASAAPQATSAAPAQANAFNPAMSLIIGGQFATLQRDPGSWHVGGFIPGVGETGPGARSFNLGESELTISANIDPYFSGYVVMSVDGADHIAVEEGYVQNSGTIPGVSLKFGRMLSAFGYLNEIHAHAWDFVDAPLVHQAFFGGKLQEDGLQARWLAPTPLFVEVGVEGGRGSAFPGSDRNTNGLNSTLLFAHLGNDVGVSGSYRIGASWRKTRAEDRGYEDVDAAGTPVVDAFTGDSTTWGLDFVWKWAPNGNTVERNFKFQAEYLHRIEDGTLAFDTAARNLAGAYHSSQSGWYAQGAYQFRPRWRVGLRYDQLDSGSTGIGLVAPRALTAADFPLLAPNRPKRATAMIDFSPSEFSRLRLQYARDEARFAEPDGQVVLQYLMSLGAHGAHKF